MVDVEFLLALSPNHPKHSSVRRILEGEEGVIVTDTCLLWLHAILLAAGKTPSETRLAMITLRQILEDYGVKEVGTMGSELLILHSSIMGKYGLSFFRSLIAASALILGEPLVSDDTSYDSIEGLVRLPLTTSE